MKICFNYSVALSNLVEKLKTKFFWIVIAILVIWIGGIELLTGGVLRKIIDSLIGKPLYFLGFVSIPLITFFSQALIWRTILFFIGYKENIFELTEYIIGDFALTSLIPSFGGSGRLARVGLLASSGVKWTISLISIIMESIVFALESIIVLAGLIILIKMKVVDFHPGILLGLEIWFFILLFGFLLCLTVAKLRLLDRFLKILRKITKSKRILKFLKELNEGFSKIVSLKKTDLFLLAGCVFFWYLSSLIEVWFILQLIGVSINLSLMILLQAVTSVTFILFPTPFGVGTVDVLAPLVFLASGIPGISGVEFTIFWRIRGIFYTIIGLMIIGETLERSFLEIFKKRNAQKRRFFCGPIGI